MDRLFEMATRVSDQAEIYAVDGRADGISFENAQLKDIESSMQSGLSLRIIKDGKLGFAYTKNLIDREELVRNALDSLKGEVEGLFGFPHTRDLPALDTYNPSIESLTNSDMVDECGRVCEILSQKTKGQLNVSAHRAVSNMRIMNSSGTDLSRKSSVYALYAQILYPYSYASLHRSHIAKAFTRAPDVYIDYLADTYSRSVKEVTPGPGRMKVLFLPETVYVLLWRLQGAANGVSIYQNISPLAGKIGEKIFDENFTVYNEPLNDSLPGARAFDDEGTPCCRFPIVEEGVLKNFYYDLYFAQKLKASPTGHGFRGSISAKPVPSLSHLTIARGKTSFSDLMRSIDRGVIIASALGAHSGNIPNGDFSIGISPGLYVEKGEIVGHVKDAMAAGNIYNTLKHIVAIEDKLSPGSGGNFPALLFDNINVTVKQ
jgi:PmbA protein